MMGQSAAIERVVMTEVTISLVAYIDLMAVMVMGVDSVVNNEGSTLGERLGFEKQ